MGRKILCVAEKPAVAKAVAQHLSGGPYQTHSINGHQYVKNYQFTFSFGPPWGQCDVTMTSVLGHLNEIEFPTGYSNWAYPPPATLFDIPICDRVAPPMKPIAQNITRQARYSEMLYIWTDCDREGEYIGSEIVRAAKEGKRDIDVKRAKFSNTERAHVIHAAKHPIILDDRQVDAVAARCELDLRLGAIFTRFTTLTLQSLGRDFLRKEDGKSQVISYGSCQFPTLGFVVDRYKKVRNFIPEQFWSIRVTQRREETDVVFSWQRNRLFDRAAVVTLFERCLSARRAKVVKVQTKPTSKWRPLPLTTVELQKLGSMFFRIEGSRIMKIAETLYQKGFISYPRTETDQFDKEIDLKKLIEKQVQHPTWGNYSQGLLEGNFRNPRSGRHNDKAHPPIHPVTCATPAVLSNEEQKVYEFIVRRFLGCCSEDAKGESSVVEIEYGPESFHADGLTVLERNYLDIYTYDSWTSSQPLPKFQLNETFEPTEAKMHDGKTTPPSYLTEPELISLMDANGIGTDATMSEHIQKIKDREYVVTDQSSDNNARPNRQAGRGGRRGGARAGRGGSLQHFIPTTLGIALIEGYDNIGLDVSLSRPFLRKEMETKMREICSGNKSRRDCVAETLEQYREVFVKANQQQDILKRFARRYVFGEPE